MDRDDDLQADKIRIALESLPVVDKHAVSEEDACPICLVSFASIFQEDEGVTMLVACGHVFCRRDLIEWIQSNHGSCPTCRHTFLELRPTCGSGEEDESSDDDYIPNEEEEEDITDSEWEWNSDLPVFAFEDAEMSDAGYEAHEDWGLASESGYATSSEADTSMHVPDPDDGDEDSDEEEENDAVAVEAATRGDDSGFDLDSLPLAPSSTLNKDNRPT